MCSYGNQVDTVVSVAVSTTALAPVSPKPIKLKMRDKRQKLTRAIVSGHKIDES